MKIAFVQEWHAEKMGYVDNCLPKAVAALGHEVHLITSNVQPYFDAPDYQETYEPFLGPGVVDCGIKEVDGYTLHRLPYAKWKGWLRLEGLRKKLWGLHPQIVQTFETFSCLAYETSLLKGLLGYKLFLESHIHASVFPPATRRGGIRERLHWRLYAATVGRWVSLCSERCYPISTDAADVVIRFFGIPKRKASIYSLGVDTSLFRPCADDSSRQVRARFRQQLGFLPSDIVCIYTGRLSGGKDPLCLAQAIGLLAAQGEPFRGLFVGSGPQTEAIRACPGCTVYPFVAFRELPGLYWTADIGVWPKQESTSQLDAAACGLPLILSKRIQVHERIDGNGLLYEEDDPPDLARQIRRLADSALRRRLGEHGARKIRAQFGWDCIAKQRVQDYEAAWQTCV
jgi:glycosyltransferase involved in cell wall biosynthesis